MFKIFKRLVKQQLGRIPSVLPIGVKEFNAFCSDIFVTYQLPDNRSYRNAIAVMILQLDRGTHKAPKYAFFATIKRAQASEVAQHMMHEYHREKDEEEQAQRLMKDVTPATDGNTVVEPVSN